MHFSKLLFLVIFLSSLILSQESGSKKFAYLVSDSSIPFWDIMSRGIQKSSDAYGYKLQRYSAENNKKKELENTIKAIKLGVDGLIISPIDSSSATTILKLAQRANIPVVIADIGSEGGEYLSYISSNNEQGAYDIGKVLVEKMQALEWDKKGSVGIIAIPQKRSNGKARTRGFMRALNEVHIKGAGIYQQVTFSKMETYGFAMELIAQNPDLRALWLQGSDKYEGALEAIKNSGKEGEILLVCFDAEPIFLELIPQGILAGVAMQQPYLMGQKAMEVMHRHLKGKEVEHEIKMEVLAISSDNIKQMLPTIKRNVLGIEVR